MTAHPSALVHHAVPVKDLGSLHVALPQDWLLVRPEDADVLLLARAPSDRTGRVSTVSITRDVLPEGLDLATWQMRTDELLGVTLDRYCVLDLADGIPQPWALRRVAAYRAGPGDSVTIEQSVALHGGIGVSLTYSGPSETYPSWADEATMMANGVMFDVRR